MCVHRRRLVLRRRRLEPQMAVVARRAVEHRVPGTRLAADPLQRGDRQIPVRLLGLLEDRQHVGRVVVVGLEDAVDEGRVDLLERPEGRIGHGPARPPQRRFLAPLAVRLGRAPVDVKPALVSMPPMSMHSIGHAWAHWKQVSHFSVPHSS